VQLFFAVHFLHEKIRSVASLVARFAYVLHDILSQAEARETKFLLTSRTIFGTFIRNDNNRRAGFHSYGTVL
jgi:hypothetical protein